MGPVKQLLVLFHLIPCTWFDNYIPGSSVVRPWNKATDSVFLAKTNKKE